MVIQDIQQGIPEVVDLRGKRNRLTDITLEELTKPEYKDVMVIMSRCPENWIRKDAPTLFPKI